MLDATTPTPHRNAANRGGPSAPCCRASVRTSHQRVMTPHILTHFRDRVTPVSLPASFADQRTLFWRYVLPVCSLTHRWRVSLTLAAPVTRLLRSCAARSLAAINTQRTAYHYRRASMTANIFCRDGDSHNFVILVCDHSHFHLSAKITQRTTPYTRSHDTNAVTGGSLRGYHTWLCVPCMRSAYWSAAALSWSARAHRRVPYAYAPAFCCWRAGGHLTSGNIPYGRLCEQYVCGTQGCGACNAGLLRA